MFVTPLYPSPYIHRFTYLAMGEFIKRGGERLFHFFGGASRGTAFFFYSCVNPWHKSVGFSPIFIISTRRICQCWPSQEIIGVLFIPDCAITCLWSKGEDNTMRRRINFALIIMEGNLLNIKSIIPGLTRQTNELQNISLCN